jgi:CTP synthase (UTP-ammonia lyase)
MDVILVTGGVHADVGKGCAAAVIGRMVARAGRTVTYRKLEPCIQS